MKCSSIIIAFNRFSHFPSENSKCERSLNRLEKLFRQKEKEKREDEEVMLEEREYEVPM